MTKPTENPWLRMMADTSRRVNAETKYDFFWITDNRTRYGLLIKFNFLLTDVEINRTVKGISVVTLSEDNSGKYYLILNDNRDWEIFLLVCTDLVNVISKCNDEFSMIPLINQRIKRWQKFLSENNTASMPEILQMGLLTELHCMFYALVPVYGYKDAVLGWVGPDQDKKDFSLKELFIEVKSFISSKGRTVKISSIQQLDHEIKPLYLTAYGLTKTERGVSVTDMVGFINEIISADDYETREVFENRLAAYGFIQNITEPPFYTFSIDLVTSYLVSDNFPKISSQNLDSRIVNVQYTIDLTKCTSFEAFLPITN
ncbi:PD-(D/E)XK motif protein [Mucilaginibacter sp. UYCu711]|uniref:PD-(D/E)XK motif protein n=1 Tax=Mucilaginibacter sp. UYCu711 TaxID=3156339 RepID=UPI003D1CD739